MKKIIITTILGIAFMPAIMAQKTRFGVTAGATGANYRTTVDGATETSDLTFGFSAGVTADLPLSKSLYFQPALQFLSKGGKETETGFNSSLTTHLYYLELPLNIVYKTRGQKGHFLIGLGPSLSYGLFGKVYADYNGITESGTLHFNSQSGLKPFEFGANFLTGYEWKSGFAVEANYNMAFTNTFDDDLSTFKNNYFGLRFIYFFKSK